MADLIHISYQRANDDVENILFTDDADRVVKDIKR